MLLKTLTNKKDKRLETVDKSLDNTTEIREMNLEKGD